MKKILAFLLAGVMVLGCVACGKGGADSKDDQNGTNEQGVKIESALDLLAQAWNEYNNVATEECKFPIAGGNAETMIMDAPGGFDMNMEGAKDALVYNYCLPEDAISMVDDVATAMNMMMSNNFTSAAYHVADTANVKAVIEGIKNTTMNNQWMCGMPEKFIVLTVGDNYVVSAFGIGDFIDTYKTAFTNVFGSEVVVAVEENIAE